jgi:methylglutaconyl-CoA hydratase
MVTPYKHLKLTVQDRIWRVTLNRPQVHNAFNAELIEELRSAFEEVGSYSLGEVRAVVLAGEGPSFCAGADVNWMRASLNLTEEDNVQDALRMARMFDTINRCRVPVVGRIHGLALGGGVGLVAVCDIVVAVEDARFAFSEVKLGIIPAVISPYVLARIGQSHARALFLTAERFGADRAARIGLVHIVVPPDRLDEEVERVLREINTSAPEAVARAKELIATLPHLPPDEVMMHTARTIASLRVGEEGQEGLRAFLEKRKPRWAR